jgi:nucleoside-diphosphate-sugar epimerase
LSKSIYNIAGGTSLTLKEVAETAASVLPGLRVEFGDDPAGSEYCLRNIDISAAIEELGYRPKFTLAAGIAAYADWMRTNNRTRARVMNAAESR